MPQGRTNEPLVVYGVNAVIELLRGSEPIRQVLQAPGPRREEVAAAAKARGVSVTMVPRDELTRLAHGAPHQGVVALAAPYRYRSLEELLGPECSSVLVLDGVQDPRNLGAILRTARAAGVGGVVLPKDRSCTVTSVVVAASAGVLFGLSIAQVTNLARTLEALREAGFWIVGLVPGAAQSLFDLDIPPRRALVVGGEGEGLRPLVRRGCDFEVSLPMAPGVESLNASVAAGVALYDLLVRRAST